MSVSGNGAIANIGSITADVVESGQFGGGGGGEYHDIREPHDRFKKYRQEKERLRKAVSIAYDKAFGAETAAAAREVLEDVPVLKQNAREIEEPFSYDVMLADIAVIEERAKLVIRLLEEDELMLMMIL